MKTERQLRIRRPEGGQSLLLMTTAAITMFGLLGLVVDIGYMYYRRQAARAAAESAALAAVLGGKAAGSYTCGSKGVGCASTVTACSTTTPPADTLGVGCLYAQSNGFSPGGNSGRQNVTMVAKVGSSPDTVSGMGNSSYWVTVRVTETIPQLFSAVLGKTTGMIAARATAAITGAAGSGACIYVLDPTANNAFVVSGAGDVEATCGVFVDSNSSDSALVVSGGAKLNAGTSFIKVVGGVSSNGHISPVPVSSSLVTDPLATSPAAPTYSGCDHTNFSLNGGSQPDMSPGVYCGGITLSGSIVKLKPGNYILNGGGLTISGSAANVTGTGVMFYNTSNGYAYKPITISGGGTVNFSAPTSDTWENMLFFEDRNTSTSSQDQITGGSNTTFSGIMYFPKTKLVYSGGSALNIQQVVIIADELEVSGPSYIGANSNVGFSAGAQTVSLVE